MRVKLDVEIRSSGYESSVMADYTIKINGIILAKPRRGVSILVIDTQGNPMYRHFDIGFANKVYYDLSRMLKEVEFGSTIYASVYDSVIPDENVLSAENTEMVYKTLTELLNRGDSPHTSKLDDMKSLFRCPIIMRAVQGYNLEFELNIGEKGESLVSRYEHEVSWISDIFTTWSLSEEESLTEGNPVVLSLTNFRVLRNTNAEGADYVITEDSSKLPILLAKYRLSQSYTTNITYRSEDTDAKLYNNVKGLFSEVGSSGKDSKGRARGYRSASSKVTLVSNSGKRRSGPETGYDTSEVKTAQDKPGREQYGSLSVLLSHRENIRANIRDAEFRIIESKDEQKRRQFEELKAGYSAELKDHNEMIKAMSSNWTPTPALEATPEVIAAIASAAGSIIKEVVDPLKELLVYLKDTSSDHKNENECTVFKYERLGRLIRKLRELFIKKYTEGQNITDDENKEYSETLRNVAKYYYICREGSDSREEIADKVEESLHYGVPSIISNTSNEVVERIVEKIKIEINNCSGVGKYRCKRVHMRGIA